MTSTPKSEPSLLSALSEWIELPVGVDKILEMSCAESVVFSGPNGTRHTASTGSALACDPWFIGNIYKAYYVYKLCTPFWGVGGLA